MSFTQMHLYYDDIAVGQEWESARPTVTETDIVNFAGLSGDFNPIHMDHEFCKTTVFRRPIAHGLLILVDGQRPGLMVSAHATLAFVERVEDWHFLGAGLPRRHHPHPRKVLGKRGRSRGKRGRHHLEPRGSQPARQGGARKA